MKSKQYINSLLPLIIIVVLPVDKKLRDSEEGQSKLRSDEREARLAGLFIRFSTARNVHYELSSYFF